MANFAEVEHLEAAWRSLTEAERPRAEYYLGVASRRIRRRWRDVDDRLAANDLEAEDVRDVVVEMVLGIVDGAPVRNAKSWAVTTGPMSKSITLAAGRADKLAFEDWMVEVFEGSTKPLPVFSMPPSGRYEGAFIWPEGRQ